MSEIIVGSKVKVTEDGTEHFAKVTKIKDDVYYVKFDDNDIGDYMVEDLILVEDSEAETVDDATDADKDKKAAQTESDKILSDNKAAAEEKAKSEAEAKEEAKKAAEKADVKKKENAVDAAKLEAEERAEKIRLDAENRAAKLEEKAKKKAAIKDKKRKALDKLLQTPLTAVDTNRLEELERMANNAKAYHFPQDMKELSILRQRKANTEE